MQMSGRKVILATDGSAGSLRAAEFAGRLLAGADDLEVLIAYVADPVPELQTRGTGGRPPIDDPPLDVMIRRHGERILTSTAAALNLPNARVQSEVLVGRPAEELIMLARSVQADMIVCGRRGLSGLQELILGSVSNRLVHNAPCPVLVVH